MLQLANNWLVLDKLLTKVWFYFFLISIFVEAKDSASQIGAAISDAAHAGYESAKNFIESLATAVANTYDELKEATKTAPFVFYNGVIVSGKFASEYGSHYKGDFSDYITKVS